MQLVLRALVPSTWDCLNVGHGRDAYVNQLKLVYEIHSDSDSGSEYTPDTSPEKDVASVTTRTRSSTGTAPAQETPPKPIFDIHSPTPDVVGGLANGAKVIISIKKKIRHGDTAVIQLHLEMIAQLVQDQDQQCITGLLISQEEGRLYVLRKDVTASPAVTITHYHLFSYFKGNPANFLTLLKNMKLLLNWHAKGVLGHAKCETLSCPGHKYNQN